MSVRVARSETFKEQAERTATEHYGSLENEVVAVVRRRLLSRNMRLDHSDLEEAYCQAWHGVCEQIKAGTKIANLTGMLVEITWRRAVDTYRQPHPGQHADVDIDAHGVEIDLDQQLDDQEKLQRFIKRLKGRLSEQECQAVGLCLIHGYTRPEARKLLGIKDEARMQKLMDGATPATPSRCTSHHETATGSLGSGRWIAGATSGRSSHRRRHAAASARSEYDPAL